MSNRTYSQAINDGKATPAFLYVWDSNQTYIDGNGATLTGCNRLLTTSDLGNFAPSINNYVYRTGDQLITGVKSFNDSTLFYNNLRFNVSNITGNFNFTSGSYRYVWTGNYQWTGTLPSYTTYSGFEFMVKHGGTTGTNLSLSGLIDYSNNATMIPYQSLNIWSNGQSWILN